MDIDARADLYSLGATFYHMITGRVPFEGPTPSAVMHKHLKEPLTPPDHLNTRLSSGCGAMIEMLMAKDREQRYTSGRELLTDLAQLARGEPPQYAQPKFSRTDLDTLSRGEALVTETEEEEEERRASTDDGLPERNALTIVLGTIAAVSVLLNLIQLAIR